MVSIEEAGGWDPELYDSVDDAPFHEMSFD